MKIYIIFIIIFIGFFIQLISSRSNIVQLTEENFNDRVVDSESNNWFIKFYTPWCHYCKEMQQEFVKLSNELSILKEVKIGEINCEDHKDFCEKQNIEGYPTLRFYSVGQKTKPEEYEGQRIAEDMIDYIYDTLEKNDELEQQQQQQKKKDEL